MSLPTIYRIVVAGHLPARWSELLDGMQVHCEPEGNTALIEREIRSKVPPLLEKRYYFPNGDHGLQPEARGGDRGLRRRLPALRALL